MTKGSKSLGYLLIIFPKHALNNVLSIAHRVESCIVHAINIVIWGGGGLLAEVSGRYFGWSMIG